MKHGGSAPAAARLLWPHSRAPARKHRLGLIQRWVGRSWHTSTAPVASCHLPPPHHILRLGTEAGTSCFRPFFRRAASTLRPPTVAMRARKPLTRARFLH